MENKYFKGVIGSLRTDNIQTEPLYKELSFKNVKSAFDDLFSVESFRPQRQVKVYTNAYGFDSFQENLEEGTLGTKRIYLGKKVMRLLKINSKIFKSASGRYFKRVKI